MTSVENSFTSVKADVMSVKTDVTSVKADLKDFACCGGPVRDFVCEAYHVEQSMYANQDEDDGVSKVLWFRAPAPVHEQTTALPME